MHQTAYILTSIPVHSNLNYLALFKNNKVVVKQK